MPSMTLSSGGTIAAADVAHCEGWSTQETSLLDDESPCPVCHGEAVKRLPIGEYSGKIVWTKNRQS